MTEKTNNIEEAEIQYKQALKITIKNQTGMSLFWRSMLQKNRKE